MSMSVASATKSMWASRGEKIGSFIGSIIDRFLKNLWPIIIVSAVCVIGYIAYLDISSDNKRWTNIDGGTITTEMEKPDNACVIEFIQGRLSSRNPIQYRELTSRQKDCAAIKVQTDAFNIAANKVKK